MIGQDTEFFLFDTKENRPIPAHAVGIERGKTQIAWEYISYFRDGYAVEFNSNPSTCRARLWSDLHKGVTYLREKILPEHVKLISDPVVPVDVKVDILGGPPDVRILGCSPTYNPYTRKQNEIEVDPSILPFRTCGAHLHFSPGTSTEIPLDICANMAKACDLLIGLPFTVIFGDDLEFQRRTLYGRAGEFRSQTYRKNESYGFEYRVLSSRLYNHPGIFSFFSGIFKYLLEHNYRAFCDSSFPHNPKLDRKLQRAINTGKGAVELLEEFDAFLKEKPLLRRDSSGMRGISYEPENWGTAFLKLKNNREAFGLNNFHLLDVLDGHWGWYEANTGKTNSSTIGALGPKGTPWRL